jgi:NTP pyrophosphatase (non-canonical NTP hydrolase)
MNITEYGKNAIKTLSRSGNLQMDSLHMVLGMVTESAEIADVYKKNIGYGKPLDVTNIKEELGDQLWYIVNMCTINGWLIEEIMDANIAKLKARYGEKFSEGAAIERDLEKEREVLETTLNASK